MRTRTKDQKYWLTQLMCFWTCDSPRFKTPWRHFLNKDGFVEVNWLNVRESEKTQNTTLGVMLDFCQDNGITIEWTVASLLEDATKISRYGNVSASTPILRILIPGGTPKRHKPVRLNPKMSEEL